MQAMGRGLSSGCVGTCCRGDTVQGPAGGVGVKDGVGDGAGDGGKGGVLTRQHVHNAIVRLVSYHFVNHGMPFRLVWSGLVWFGWFGLVWAFVQLHPSILCS
jgi:hypothetical protein